MKDNLCYREKWYVFWGSWYSSHVIYGGYNLRVPLIIDTRYQQWYGWMHTFQPDTKWWDMDSENLNTCVLLHGGGNVGFKPFAQCIGVTFVTINKLTVNGTLQGLSQKFLNHSNSDTSHNQRQNCCWHCLRGLSQLFSGVQKTQSSSSPSQNDNNFYYY